MLDLSKYDVLQEKVQFGVKISLAPKGFPYYAVSVVSDSYEAAIKAAILTEEFLLSEEQHVSDRKEVIGGLEALRQFKFEEA